MDYRQLGRTDIKVSSICLGTMTWGEQNTEAEGHAQLDVAVDAGINFIDTAEMYPIPPSDRTYGKTEEIFGNWLKQHGKRDQLIIATKICPPGKHRPWIRGQSNRLDLENIQKAVDASLKRLQTDYIDLYQVHWPERYTNYFGQLNYTHNPDLDGTPIDETLEALDAVVKSGKVRHIGISNETPWGVSRYLLSAEQKGLSRIVSIQNPYNLLNRTFEIALSEIAIREKVGLLAYSPLGFGVLTAKYMNDARPDGARLSRFDTYKRYLNENGVKMTARYAMLAQEFQYEPAQLALAFILTRTFLTSMIIGATNLEQLRANIDTVNIKLPEELIKSINSLHFQQPNPCP